MKRQKTKAIWTVLVAVFFLFLPSCEREEDLTAGRIEVLSEKYGGSSAKLAVCDSVSTWSSGDRLRINGDVAEVEIIDGHAYIGDAVARDVNRALFPATLASGDLGSDEVTVTLPAAYHYRTDGSGRQVLDIPMAATSSGTNPLEFKHLTGLLCITIKNTRAESIILQSLTVTSNKYQLSGSRTIDFSSITTIAPIVAANEADRSATLAIGGAVTLNSNSTATFLIPVAPVGSDNSFTITVVCNNSSNRFSYSRSQSISEGVDRSLVRNQIGYVFSKLEDMSFIDDGRLLERLGDGSFCISTPEDFVLMVQTITNNYSFWYSNETHYYSKEKYKIMTDINMSGYTINPINIFTGEIDGNGKVISNLTIEGCSVGTNYACALFHGAGGANIIHDITLDNLSLVVPSNIDCDGLFIGAICSEPAANITITKCKVILSSVEINGSVGDIFFGGLVGRSSNCSVTLENDTVNILSHTINSSGLLYYGGFIGRMEKPSTIVNSKCQTNATISTSNRGLYAGGFEGRSSGLSVTNSSVTGSISAATSSVTCKLGKYIGWLASGSLTPSNSSSSIAFTKNGSPYSAPNYE